METSSAAIRDQFGHKRDQFGHSIVFVADGPRHLDLFHQDLTALSSGHALAVARYPALEVLPGHGAPNADLAGDRLNTLRRCLEAQPPAIIATCVQALQQPSVSPRALSRLSLHLAQGESHELEELSTRLDEMRYEFTAEVEDKGQASRRGGLLDIWPASEDWPVRIEFFGDVVDSIRSFDPVAQRSIEQRTRVWIPLTGEQGGGASPKPSKGSLLDFLPAKTCWVWSDPESIRHHAESYRQSIDDPADRRPEIGRAHV